MIRINLLEETRVAAKAKGGGISLPKLEVAENVPVFILAGGVMLAILVMGLWGMSNKIKQDKLATEIRQAEETKKQLEYVLKRHEELEAKKADLLRKIGIIEELKQKQDVPVRLLDQVSSNLADGVWLEELTFANDKVDLRGWAQTPLAYSQFLRNLEESTFFTEVASGIMEVRQDLTRFRMTMKLRPPGPPPGAPGAAGAATTTAPATPPAGQPR